VVLVTWDVRAFYSHLLFAAGAQGLTQVSIPPNPQSERLERVLTGRNVGFAVLFESPDGWLRTSKSGHQGKFCSCVEERFISNIARPDAGRNMLAAFKTPISCPVARTAGLSFGADPLFATWGGGREVRVASS
jgi:hypothetical protein